MIPIEKWRELLRMQQELDLIRRVYSRWSKADAKVRQKVEARQIKLERDLRTAITIAQVDTLDYELAVKRRMEKADEMEEAIKRFSDSGQVVLRRTVKV